MQIPFFKPFISDKDVKAVSEAMLSGWLTKGPVSVKFEKALCDYTGAKYATVVNSCTSALHLALLAVGVKPGDKVITTPYTFVATANAIRYCGAEPVFVDVDYDYNINPYHLRNIDWKGIKAVLVVDFAGRPCDYNSLREIVPKGIPIVGDAAHSISAKYMGKKIGNVADITCFSFYATKCMTTGDGGAVLTNNPEWHEFIQKASQNALSRDAWKRYGVGGRWEYDVEFLGYKYNMPDMNAALGLSQLEKVETMRDDREDTAQRYDAELVDFVRPQPYPMGVIGSHHLYILNVNNRNEWFNEMAKRGISCSVHCIPVPSFTAYGKQDMKQWPVCQKLFESSVSLPIYPGLSKQEVNYIIGNILEIGGNEI